ncbi:MAG: M23 family metallopeptidase [Nocardioidaceae bacterium]|nr:M23 family metallopeptidase [Nocardioidaceae bacterium]
MSPSLLRVLLALFGGPVLLSLYAGVAGPVSASGVVPVAAGADLPMTARADDRSWALTGEGVWPLDPNPTVVSGFDRPGAPWAAGHRGVDLAGRVGQSVRAALGGTVTFAGSLAGRGVVVVAHGGARTTYEPVSAAVTVGDMVATGDRVGHLQLFGSHCFPRSCLHWGLLVADVYEDPLTLVGGGPVRLLPWLGPAASPIGPMPRRWAPVVSPTPLGAAAWFRSLRPAVGP